MRNITLQPPIPSYFYQLPKWLLFLFLFTYSIHGAAQGWSPCSQITFSFINYQPCCYRISINNSSECYPFLRLVLDGGTFASWGASTQTGWKGTLTSPTELLLTHDSGRIPLGVGTPVGFCLPPGVSSTLTVFYESGLCPPGDGCAIETQLAGCPDPANGSITGVKYRECGQNAYTNQTTIPDWNISLFDAMGTLIAEEVTTTDGSYAFYDLPAGTYVVKEAVKTGWTPKFPANGQSTVDLSVSEHETRNFGNCPDCSCDSLYTDVVALDGDLDTCGYNLIVQNTGGECYTHLRLSINAGKLTSWQVTEPGWSVEPIDPQNIRINPPAGYVPLGTKYPITFKATGSDVFEITVRAYYNIGNGEVVCARAFAFMCPKPAAVPCCPSGTVQGPELVVNGDFSGGNTGFTSFMMYIPPGNKAYPGIYSVLQSNQVYWANNQWACTDHTSNSSTGKMLIVDGPSSNIAWQETVTVTPNTQYAFCAYVNNLILPTKIYPDPIVQLWVNGAQVQTITLPETPDVWQLLLGTWSSGNTSGSILIQIRLGSTNGGNDFAVDDISFRACLPPSACTPNFSFQNINSCGKVQFTDLSTPTSGLTYAWDFGDNQNSNQQSPMHQYSQCGTFTVCLTISGPACPTQKVFKQIIVADNIPPVITCRSDTVVFAKNLPCSILVNGLGFVSYTDNCFVQVANYLVTGATTNFGQNDASGLTYNSGVSTITYTGKDWCGNTATCSFKVTVVCDTMQCACPGSVPGTNLVNNGNFSAGNVGFTSALTNSGGCGAGNYGIVTNFSSFCTGWGPLAANSVPNFMAIDGSTAPGARPIWQSPVALISNTSYCFSFFWALAFPNSSQNFQISIDIVDAAGNVVSNPSANLGTATIVTNLTWTNATINWTSGTLTGPHFIAIRQLTGGSFRDFGIDDICFRSTMQMPCVANAGIDKTICQGENTTLTATGGGTYLWVPGGSTTATITVSPTTTTTYTVTTVLNGCTATDQVTVTVLPNPQAVITGNTTICAGQSTTLTVGPGTGATYQWNTTNTTSSIVVSPLVSTVYCVTCTAQNGCTSTACINVIVLPKPQAAISGNLSICLGQSTVLTATGGGTYLWSVGGATTAAVTVTPTIVAHTYTVTVTGTNGCTATATVNVVINPAPGVLLTGQTICAGQSATITASGGGTYLWSFGGTTTASLTVTPGTTTTYTVTVTSPQGCTGTASATVTVLPGLIISPNQTICEGQTATIMTNCSPGDLFSWTPGGATTNFIIVAPITTTTYTVTVTTGACTYTASSTVTVIPTQLNVGLTGAFPFNFDPTLGTAEDISATLANGTATNVTQVSAANSTLSAYNFNGTTSKIVSNSNTRGVTNAVTLVAWVKTTETANGMWVAGQYSFNNDHGYSLGIGNNASGFIGKVAVGGRDGTGLYHTSGYGTASPMVNDGNWHCIAGTAGNNQWSAFVDGNLTSTAAGSTAGGILLTANTAPFTIGWHTDGNFPLWYNGDMDDVAIYNRVLTDCEIRAVCASQAPSDVPNLDNTYNLRIYPNPNAGSFTIELPEPANASMSFRITDLTGRLVLEKQADAGSEQQYIQANMLANGLYFLQVIAEGRVVAIEKFVKQ